MCVCVCVCVLGGGGGGGGGGEKSCFTRAFSLDDSQLRGKLAWHLKNHQIKKEV